MPAMAVPGTGRRPADPSISDDAMVALAGPEFKLAAAARRAGTRAPFRDRCRWPPKDNSPRSARPRCLDARRDVILHCAPRTGMLGGDEVLCASRSLFILRLAFAQLTESHHLPPGLI